MELSILLAFTVASALISLAPGPDMMFIIANGIARGRKAGVIAALGMSTGIAIHTVAAAAGLGALLAAAPVALDVMRVLGAIFLVYLAITTWRASRKASTQAEAPVPQRSMRKMYVMAVLTNLANPKVILFYLAFFPQFISDHGMPPWAQFLTLGAILICVGLAVDATVGFISGALSEFLQRRPAIRRWMDRVSAAIFGALAVRLVADPH
ncbi:LysE family translocator [Kibdelosporangium phytohabitans]|uniref:Lysine transporter LysE n=1 Tax=Kibdelosporangium phytohabitans TaxID=860235 RepID=A0A0N9HZ08_9PSEU|nr:LysE family translocator [Kibdelosporangium phytohabitans]ALG12554.1 lysine transporter LysE [Kibdelosporangium phytohabitans]MBE1464169.1 threonine/homoserine/homoserine lactone efflux protein [Kibdelosporangium phytohabitans]